MPGAYNSTSSSPFFVLVLVLVLLVRVTLANCLPDWIFTQCASYLYQTFVVFALTHKEIEKDIKIEKER